MIISKTPLRICFFCGGSDIPAFYEQEDGESLSATIDKYNYVCANEPIDDKIRFSYKDKDLSDYNIFNQTLEFLKKDLNPITIHSVSDINFDGTGLGSSSAFVVGLIKALMPSIEKRELAEAACYIEMVKCNLPCGKQDSYSAAYGGFNYFSYSKDGSVEEIGPFIIRRIMKNLEENLLLVHTGIERDSRDILSAHTFHLNKNMINISDKKYDSVKNAKNKVYEGISLLHNDKLDEFGELLDLSWKEKRNISGMISSNIIDEIYDSAKKAGAIGGKLLGAGGGGCMLFYVKPSRRLYVIEAIMNLNKTNISGVTPRIIDFKFTDEGSKIIV